MRDITVAYATYEEQVEIPLQVDASVTVAVAIRRSGILSRFPDISLDKAVVGIHGKKVALDGLLNAGDRIEIYRPLQLDPKQARRLRAKKVRQQ